ncbi:MAG: hypothetical protein ACOCXH_05725 [Cyclobacteriaceae bacterium]
MKNQVTNNSRRDFLKESILLGGSIMFLPTAFANTSAETLPGRLVRQIMLDQAISQALASPKANDQHKKVLTADLYQHLPGNIARIGWTFPMQKDRIIQLLKAAKADYTGSDPSEFALEKVALSVGALAAWPIHQIKNATSSEAALYQDAAMLKHLNGKQPAEKIIGKAEDLALLFKEMIPRTHTRMHTSIPDDDDPQGWILRVNEWRRNTVAYFDQLALAYLNPDKEKVKKFVIDPKFYVAGDNNCVATKSIWQGSSLALATMDYFDNLINEEKIENLM